MKTPTTKRKAGRPKTPLKNLNMALELYENDYLMTISQICRACEISRSTFYAALRKAKTELKDTYKE